MPQWLAYTVLSNSTKLFGWGADPVCSIMLNQANWRNLFQAIIAKTQPCPHNSSWKLDWFRPVAGYPKGKSGTVLRVPYCLFCLSHLCPLLGKNFIIILRQRLCVAHLLHYHVTHESAEWMNEWAQTLWALLRKIPQRSKGNKMSMIDMKISFFKRMGSLSQSP